MSLYSIRKCIKTQGFSLVELSIVLVILGLLTGGILTGQSLIKAAELRALTTQMQHITTATYTFRDKYIALPGDMTNATSFWGAAHADPTTCSTTASTGTETCNGNGDGLISGLGGSSNYERFRYWHHLANAGLLEGSYSGISGTANTYHVIPGVNAPHAKYGGNETGLGILWWAASTGNATRWPNNYGNYVSFGRRNDPNDAWLSVLTAEEAWNIDKKIDDGRPSKGKLLTFRRDPITTVTDCHTTQDSELAEYNVANTNVNCTMIFLLGF